MTVSPNNASDCGSDYGSNYPLDTLDLLVPWDIPLECELEEPVKQQIADSLRSLTQALNTADFLQSITTIEQIIASLPKAKTYPANPIKTKTALSTAAIEEYDTYFRVSHVQTNQAEDIALCLTAGLLVNCHRFVSLCCGLPALELAQINRQKQGFLSYISLLERTFNINSAS